MPPASRGAGLATILSILCLMGSSMGLGFAAEETPPELRPKILFLGRVGGPGDQCIRQVYIKGRRIAGTGGKDFSLQVSVNGFDGVKASAHGNINAQQKVGGGIRHVKRGNAAGVVYGYRQVHKNLQQPYMEGPGWKLWGWGFKQAQAKSYMADSGIRLAKPMPNGNIFAVGITDGGNTSLHADPRDINKRLKFSISHGGGRGKSSFLYEIDKKGKLQRQMVLRGSVNDACWDKWGRMLAVGWGVIRKPSRHSFGYEGGGGILMTDKNWSQELIGTFLGREPGTKIDVSLWCCAIDSVTGLAAVGGYVSGNMRQHHPVQKKEGGGKDGLLAVIRLWKPASTGVASRGGKK